MFIYEGKKRNEANTADVEVLNIVFQSTQIPAATPDVQVWKDGTTIYAKIGDNTISGSISE